MRKILLYLTCTALVTLVGCMSAADAKKHNAEAFKTPEIIGEIDGHKVYHYTIYAKYGDSYTTHNVYYVKGTDTVTTIHGSKPKHVNIMVNGVEYAPIQPEIDK